MTELVITPKEEELIKQLCESVITRLYYYKEPATGALIKACIADAKAWLKFYIDSLP